MSVSPLPCSNDIPPTNKVIALDSVFIVGARLNSSRLPAKHLLDLAGKPVIARIFERLNSCTNADNLVLATTADEYNQPLARWADAQNIHCVCYDGDVNDLVGRVDSIVQRYSPKIVVYICGDCPLLAPDYIDRAVTALQNHPEWDAIACAKDALGNRVIHEGMLIVSLDGWRKIVENSTTPLFKEHVGLGAPADFVRGEILEPSAYYQRQHRISVDTAADYRFINEIYQRWYRSNDDDAIVDLSWVIGELNRDASLVATNSHVMQKSGFQRYGRITIVCEASAEKGIGQLRRSVKVAERIQEEMGLGTQLFILGRETALPFIRFCNCTWFANEQDIISAINEDSSPLLVIDVFPERQSKATEWKHLLESKQAKGVKIIGLDRCVDWWELCDKVIVPSFREPEINDDRVVWGWPYVIAERVPWQPHGSEPLLVLTGGSDPLAYGDWLPQALDNSLAHGTLVRWVQGPFAKAPVLPSSALLNWEVIESPESMLDLMREAHTALCVYGVSLFELLAIGVPTAVLPSPSALSESRYESFSAMGLAMCLQHFPADLAKLNLLLSSDNIRGEYRAAMGQTPIGDGVKNIVGEIAEVLSQGD